MTTQQYIDNLNKRFQTGISREHAYRGDLQLTLETLLKDVQVINEPARIACGAPDYILTRKDIPVGYIEAKDVGVDLNSKSLKEQFDRYRASLTNLIFTDYLDFHFYRDGVFVNSIRIAEISNGVIVGKPDQYAHFEQLMKDFAQTISQTIKSPTKLAEMMAGKARLLANIIEQAVSSDEENEANSQLKDQYKAFQNVLVHDITHKAFADMYAQTIAYGMFAARYHDPTIPTFSREEAATLIPHSNPFLRKLFQTIAGYDLDARIAWIVDDLVQIFLASDVAVIMRNFGKSTKQDDPIIHFYETFLAAYDPSLRKSRGVWYTPEPVVNFIVRAVDDILKSEFNLPQGLADTSKTKIKVDYQGKKIEQEVHKVQVLDPATGTGTFLAEVIKHIHQKFKNQAGIWPKYVENDLIPRLNGFELLMTSYAMAHLKMDILLTETGFTNPNNKRFKIFLTNSLEEPHDNQFNLFTQWLSQEANEANAIKKDAPVMCVIGNPPYSVSSTNKGPWIQNLIADYKKDLNERKINLDDDYIKFIRYGQHFIDKNGEGVLAYISANSFLDGLTHRQMRKSLLESFDKIYIIDLHGNSKKKEICPDGSPDQNVFDIMTGVSINLFIKTGTKNKNELAKLYHIDLFGKRDLKYDFLTNNNLNSISWDQLNIEEPNWFFIPKNFSNSKEYNQGFRIDELFRENNTGIQTKRDSLVYQFNSQSIKDVISYFESNDKTEISKKYNLPPDGRDWSIEWAQMDINKSDGKFIPVHYHPFDTRQTYFTGRSKGFMAYPRSPLMNVMLEPNVALLAIRNSRRDNVFGYFISNKIVDKDGVSPFDNCKVFPLFLSSLNSNLFDSKDRTNLKFEIVKKIIDGINQTFVPNNKKEVSLATNSKGDVYPLDIFDYIYAALHSPSYREKYKEFLKIDFPRVPYPTDADKFWKLVALGKELREIHLLESPKVEEYITGYPEDGDNIVGKPTYKNGSVYINETQYFSNVPEVAWNFYIGGYQPAQKWLKDRKERELSYDDILHYQKIIVALSETDRIMKEIDEVGTL
jgi:predicted helicase